MTDDERATATIALESPFKKLCRSKWALKYLLITMGQAWVVTKLIKTN